MKWILASKEVVSDHTIKTVEEAFHVTFPETFVSSVKNNNEGRPRPNVFDTKETIERSAKALLSFDLNKSSNIITVNQTIKGQIPDKVIAFMSDSFGNFICFDYREATTDPNIVFWNHEEVEGETREDALEAIANTFEGFLALFRELDE